MKEESENTGLKLNIQKTKIMASGPITSWQIEGEKVKIVTDFIIFWLQNHCGRWLQPWNLKMLALWEKKAMTKLDSVLKGRDITFPTKVCIVKATIFPVVMHECKSRTIKKAELWRIDAFELGCCRRLLRVPWTARRSNQSVLNEINP